MSGPKTYEYDVTWDNIEAPVALSQAELRKQQQNKQDLEMETQNLRWQANELNQLLTTILAKLNEHSENTAPSSDNLERLRDYIELTRDQIKSARTRLKKQRDLASKRKRSRSEKLPLKKSQSAIDALADYDAENNGIAKIEDNCQNSAGDARTQASQSVYDMVNDFHAQFSVPLSSEIEKSIDALKRSKDSAICNMFVEQIKDQFVQLKQQIRTEQLESEKLLEKIPGGTLPESVEAQVFELRQKLIAIASGKGRLDYTDRERADYLLAEINKLKAARASTVVEATLKDLGYETEPISETLFTEGGAIYFRQTGMDEPYYVRMLINPDQGSCNYNVVRDGDSPSEHADVQMERTWCDSIPQLQNTLQSRGVSLKLKRHNDPGTVPVQKISSTELKQSYWDSKSEVSRQEHQRKKITPKARSQS